MYIVKTTSDMVIDSIDNNPQSHNFPNHIPYELHVDGGLSSTYGWVTTAIQCECGRWVEIPTD